MSIATKRGFTLFRTSESKGFTLIELLVVIAIIGLLASVVIASLSSARAKGRDARRVADLKSIQLANELFFDATGNYASSSAFLAPTYIAKVPVDPGTGSAYVYAGLGSGTTCNSYHIGAVLESVSGSQGVLASDADASAGTGCTGGGTDFIGQTVGCTGALNVAGDTCYDLKP